MYPLHRTWSLYFHSKNKEKTYSQNTIKIIDIESIETFWRTYNNIPQPKELFNSGFENKVLRIEKEYYVPNAYSFFEKGVYPTWDATNNINGAELSIRKFKGLPEMNEIWENSLIYLISENFEFSKNIKGIRFVDSTLPGKPMYRIEYWFDNVEYKIQIQEYIKKMFNIKTNLLYRVHKDVKES